MGGPGAGKGTQCKLLIKKHSYLDSYSCGDLLRAKAKTDPKVHAKLARGEIISSDLTTGLMKEYMGNRCSTKTFLADGFPRNEENIEAWDRILGDHVEVRFLMHFKLSDESMLSRLRGRHDETPVE
jgi:UMP-CMP kinase